MGVNDDLLSPLESESFFNRANGTTVIYTPNGIQSGSGSNGASPLVISYHADTDSYTLSSGAASSTFAPADIISTMIWGQTYEKVSGQVTNTLVLGTGYETDFGYSQIYSANGRWVTARQRRDNIEYDIRSFVYGIPTPNAQVPITGRAGYRVSLLGARTSQFESGLLNLSGGGSIIVQFDTGEILLDMTTLSSLADGGLISAESMYGRLNGTAQLSSLTNQFDGTFTLSGNGGAEVYSGSLTGGLFGPSAEEIGGTFNGSVNNDIFVSAAFSGAGIPDVAVGDTLASLAGTNHLYGIGLSVFYGFPFSIGGTLPYVSFDADTGIYRFRSVEARYYAGQGSMEFGPSDREPTFDDSNYRYYVTGTGTDQLRVGMFQGSVNGISLTYTSFARVLGTTEVGGLPQPSLDYISFGSATPVHQFPTSGSASYSGTIFGDARNNTTLLFPLFGSSSMNVDFETQALTATLRLEANDGFGGSMPVGNFDFTGNLFYSSGLFNASGHGLAPGAAVMAGVFYGDVAQEYAAVFSVNDVLNGLIYDGITVGFRD